MKALQQAFVYGENPVRTVTKNRETWFVVKDVCKVMELDNVTRAVERLDDDEKGFTTIQSLGGPQEMVAVNEPGLYSLILTSRKPEAKAFKRWITHEVLPAIRKTGSYTSKTSSTELLTCVSGYKNTGLIPKRKYWPRYQTAIISTLTS